MMPHPGSEPDSLAPPDTSLVDSIFDAILTAVEQGEEIDIDAMAANHLGLRPALEGLVDVARGACPTAARSQPPHSPEGYTIIAELGRGGMASVYLARQHNVSHRPVALKMLPELLTTHSTRERFRREVAAIASLRHPSIVPVHDVVRDGDAFFFAMEFIDGGSLQDVIQSVTSRGERTMLDAALEAIGVGPGYKRPHDYCNLIAMWGIHIADALHTVHSAGLLHRDVKPSNILLRRDGTALLSDFGLVRDTSAATLTASGVFSGTAIYSPPEQLLATRAMDARSDVYSLGATLFHALTLRRPYPGESAVQVLHAIGDRAAPHMRGSPWVPRDLETVVRKAMDPDASRRYASAADFAADLARFLEARPVLARRATLAYTTSRLFTRYRTQIGAGVLGSLIVATIAALMFVRAVWWPVWSDLALLDARSAAFAQSPYDDVFNIAFFEHVTDPRPRARQLASSAELQTRLARSIKLYDVAIRYGSPRPDVRAERDGAAQVLGFAPDAPHATRDANKHHLADGYIDWLLDPESPTKDPWPNVSSGSSAGAASVHAALAMAPAIEARKIGLIAYTLGDTNTALAAWSRLDAIEANDSFAEGVLGVLLLIQDQPYPAYARLYRASVAYPRDANLALYAADAAVRCGDLVKARRLLEAARSLAGVEPSGMTRVELMLRLAEGETDAVIAETRRLFATPYANASVVLALQIAQRLEQLGEPQEKVLEFAALAASGAPPASKAAVFFWPYAEEYWLSLTEQERRGLLVALISDWAAESPRGKTWRSCVVFAMTYLVNFSEHEMSGELRATGFAEFSARVMSLQTDSYRVVSDAFESGDAALRDRVLDWFFTGNGVSPEQLPRASGIDESAPP